MPPRRLSIISLMRSAAAMPRRRCPSSSGLPPRAPTGRSALTALGRHFTQLHRVAAAPGSGTSLEQAAKSLKPRLHFKREPVFIAHCKRWGAGRLSHALPLIQEAVRRSRRSADLEGALAERLVLTLTSRI